MAAELATGPAKKPPKPRKARTPVSTTTSNAKRVQRVGAAAKKYLTPPRIRDHEPMTLPHFREWCSHLLLDNGKPFILEPFQEQILEAYFNGAAETIVLLPKKNGKTTLFAALAMYVLLHTHNAEIFVAAAAQQQAGQLYNFCKKFLSDTPWLDQLLKGLDGSYRIIRTDGDEGFIKCIGSDARTADGATPTLALIDELHRHKNGDLYGVLVDGLPAREGRSITISTAGDNELSPLGKLRQKALAMPGLVVEGAHKHVLTDDGSFAFHEWSLKDDDDLTNFNLVKTANPLSARTVQVLKQQFNSPSMTPWRWARFMCGIWLSGEESALDTVAVRACTGTDMGEVAEGEPVWVGMDVGWTRDTTALVPYTLDEETDRELVGVPRILVPPGGGVALESQEILDAIASIHDRNPIEALCFDPNAEGRLLAEDIQAEFPEIRIIEVSQEPSGMADAAMDLSEALRKRRIILPNHKGLLAHLLATAPKIVTGGSDRWRFVKGPGRKPIDAAIALSMVRQQRLGLGKKRKRKRMSFAEMQQLHQLAA